ncbi:MAG: hypothetical protein LBM03_00290 [Erysipelotrichaceae bacterium]|jgi:hypothetical protein|nr:hypothetical protein [Erysipelotrichaceae bacterium]
MSKKNNFILLSTLFFTMLAGCGPQDSSSSKSTVTLTFLQHRGIGNYEGATLEAEAVYEKKIIYEYGCDLTSEMIDGLQNKVGYITSVLYENDRIFSGYFTHTGFFINYDENTEMATNKIQEMTLSDDMTLHFAIWG